MTRTLLTIGHGYTAAALARRLLAAPGWRLFGTTRKPEKLPAIEAQGVTPLLWPEGDLRPALAEVTHLLISAAPGETGDPFLAEFGSDMAQLAPNLEWVGYLGTTGVYGDHGGEWVDETTPISSENTRSAFRIAAEAEWLASGLPVHIFRLSGIYGPGRGPFARLRAGNARNIVKAGQVFCRIHVEDIAQTLEASIARPNPRAIYNLADDLPASTQEVLAHAAALLGIDPPPEEPFESAEMSPMARSFYAECRRVSNARIKSELGVSLQYPTYREGFAAMLAEDS